MKRTYLVLSGIGFVLPNIFVTKVSVQTGNLLLWINPMATIQGMFVNDISTAFVVDLLFVVVVFFTWTWIESGRQGLKRPWLIWFLTMLFGMAGTLPLFLYQRESARQSS